MWTMQNTEGFTQSTLDMINDVVAQIKSENPEIDESIIDDRINNVWVEGISKKDLYQSAKF